jgi:hypothetical protein
MDDPDTLRRIIADPGIDQRLREALERALPEALDFEEQKARWNAQFEIFIAAHRASLLHALRQGSLQAFGKKLQPELLQGFADDLEYFQWPDKPPPPAYVQDMFRDRPGFLDREWNVPAWEPIPAEFWSEAKVRWEDFWAASADIAYCLILVEVERLLKVFAPPQAEPYSGAVKIAGTLAYSDTSTELVTPRRRGRPPFSWREFHVEADSHIRAKGLPDKQLSFIADMQAWCLAKWGKAPKDSTIAGQLSRYYQAQNPSKNSD